MVIPSYFYSENPSRSHFFDASLDKEEARLARLYMAGKINEESYDLLRKEWQEKSINVQTSIKRLEFDARQHLDDLDTALTLITRIPDLWGRFRKKERTLLLRTFIKQIIIDQKGEIISYKLHSPFVYLSALANQLSSFESKEEGRSTLVSVSTPTATRTQVSASGGQRSIH